MRFRALSLALLLAACDLPAEVEPAPNPVTLTIQGTVLDERGRTPVADARVGLLREGEYQPAFGDVPVDARGRYAISTTVARAECQKLRVAGMVRSRANAGITSLNADRLRCTGAPQTIDVVLRFEPF